MTETNPQDLMARLDRDARAGGYLLNPNKEDTLALCEGLLTNTKRFGYPSCPCRVADGNRDKDRDIICPCDYRDPDLNDWGACYCALYVTKEWIDNNNTLERKVVPERRPPPKEREKLRTAHMMEDAKAAAAGQAAAKIPEAGHQLERVGGKYPIWRCTVCGYLCAREKPPNICPICKVTSDRFERFA
jgi:ferredoxin-thioredoxin reductase catalytic chain